ncbi:MAG: hypothetical protein M3Q03_10110 [Chloroflexota bacterium]|nr:hypothetical protein [Chloroflexota bacterium]
MTSRRTSIVCGALLVLTALVRVWVPPMVRAAPQGAVWAWGENGNGQWGNSPGSLSLAPVQVGGLIGVTDIAAGSAHKLALRRDGSVWTWGANARGQLGNGTVTDSLSPIPVGGLGRAVAVAAGTEHSLALLADGTVWAWGANDAGQLGEASPGTCGRRDAENPVLIGCSPTPVQVEGLSGVTSVASGAHHNLALLADGTVWAWGANTGRSVLGPGAPESGCDFTSCSRTPTPVDGLDGVSALAAGASHNLALLVDGTVRSWGVDANGQLGRPSEPCGRLGCGPTPGYVSGLREVTAIAAGGDHSLALRADGTVWAWGQNFYSQSGSPSSFSSGPATVGGLTGMIDIAAGPAHSLALGADGSVWVWGANAYGYDGRPGPDFCSTESSVPISCSPMPSQVGGLHGVIAIAAGGAHNLALGSEGHLAPPQLPASVWGWSGGHRRCHSAWGWPGCGLAHSAAPSARRTSVESSQTARILPYAGRGARITAGRHRGAVARPASRGSR